MLCIYYTNTVSVFIYIFCWFVIFIFLFRSQHIFISRMDKRQDRTEPTKKNQKQINSKFFFVLQENEKSQLTWSRHKKDCINTVGDGFRCGVASARCIQQQTACNYKGYFIHNFVSQREAHNPYPESVSFHIRRIIILPTTTTTTTAYTRRHTQWNNSKNHNKKKARARNQRQKTHQKKIRTFFIADSEFLLSRFLAVLFRFVFLFYSTLPLIFYFYVLFSVHSSKPK